MNRRRSLGSIFWALMLVSVGVLLLARNLGYSIPIWRSLALYWPVLIIGWGLLKVVDYYRLRDERASIFGVGEVILLVFVVLAGSGLTAAANLGSDFGLIGLIGEEFDLFDILGENYEFESEIAADIDAGRTIEIHNRFGTVEVEAGETGSIEVAVEKVVRAASAADAEELEPDLTFSIEERGERYVVASNRDRLPESVRRRFRTNLRIRVPENTPLEVDNGYGPVRITGLRGDQVVDNRYGAVKVNQIEGSLRIEDRYGPVSVGEVSGDVAVTNAYGAVALDQVGGGATVENRFGPVELTNVRGPSVIDNRYSTVEVRSAGGDVRVTGRNNRVELEDIQGGVEVDTSYRSVDARNLMGSIDVESRHGDVLLRFDQAPSESIAVTGEYANVRLELPSDSSFFLDAQVRAGGLDSDFEGFEREGSGRDMRVTGQQGVGGPRVTINAARGDVRLIGRN